MSLIHYFVLPAVIAFILQMILCPVGIPILHKMKFGQYIRELGPKEHQKKAGTPTMGGIMIMIAFVIAAVVMFRFDAEFGMVMFLTVGFGVIGFIDDYLKVVKKKNEGLNVRNKWILQSLVAIIFIVFMILTKMPTSLPIPFTEAEIELSWFYYVLIFFYIMAFVNGVNLTDGLDGLAGSVTAVVTMFFMFAAFFMGSSTVIAGSAMFGALLGFLVFNVNPAKVFMGDTGSLALGGFVSAMAIVLRMPLILIVVGLVYVIEDLSVVLQVGYFKLTHGKRLFKMAPIHHHFELCGWKETKIKDIFTIVTIMMALLSMLSL